MLLKNCKTSKMLKSLTVNPFLIFYRLMFYVKCHLLTELCCQIVRIENSQLKVESLKEALTPLFRYPARSRCVIIIATLKYFSSAPSLGCTPAGNQPCLQVSGGLVRCKDHLPSQKRSWTSWRKWLCGDLTASVIYIILYLKHTNFSVPKELCGRKWEKRDLPSISLWNHGNEITQRRDGKCSPLNSRFRVVSLQ